MTRMTNVKRAAAGGAVAALLLTGGAVSAQAASPTETVAECLTAKMEAKDAAKTVFKDAKAAAWSAFATTVETTNGKGSKKAAAKERRMALKAALKDRKQAFKTAKSTYRICVLNATDAQANSVG